MTDQILSPFEQALTKASRALNATEEEVSTLRRVAESTKPDLPEFLLARIAEDEAAAREASYRGRWQSREDFVVVAYADEWVGDAVLPDEDVIADGVFSPANAEHIARHDPARVLAELYAKRGIVEGIRDATSGGVTEYYIGPMMTTDNVLQFLALPYADHPDYRDEWRP